jgi:tetratricopeptide (TPR) repeat protein
MKYGAKSLSLLLVILFIIVVSPVCGEEMENQHTTGKKDPAVADCLAPGHKAASQGYFDEAIKIFTVCAEKHPNSAEPYFFLGMAYFRKKDVPKATAAYKKATELDPSNIEASAMLGRLYSMDKQKLVYARQLLEHALSAAPNKDDVRFDLARVYGMLGQRDKSVNEFKRLFAGEPKYGVYHTEFAKILISAGEKKAARNHLLRAVALAPDFEPARKLLQQLDKDLQASISHTRETTH